MADGTRLNSNTSTGDMIATDDITDGGVADGQKAQRAKMGFGSDGAYADVNQSDPLPVGIVGADSKESAKVTNNALDINIQDQHTRALDLRFVKVVSAPTSLAAASVVDGRTLTLVSASGFADGSYVLVAETGERFYLGTQQGAAIGNVITLDTPLDKVYPIGSTVLNLTYAMNVDGSSTPQVFQVGSSDSTAVIDVTRVMGYMQSGNTMEDDKFGSLPALTNGCVLRLSNSEKTNLWNVKTNADLALLAFDFTYPDSPPAGEHSARFRSTYAGQTKHGVTLRLAAGESLEFIIQDDLTGLDVFTLMAQGHTVE